MIAPTKYPVKTVEYNINNIYTKNATNAKLIPITVKIASITKIGTTIKNKIPNPKEENTSPTPLMSYPSFIFSNSQGRLFYNSVIKNK